MAELAEPLAAATETTPTQTIRSYLESSASRTAVGQIVVAVLIALVATSRAAHHTVSPAALVGLVTALTGGLAVVGWIQGVFGGAGDLLAGRVVPDPEPLGGPRWAPDHAARAAERRYDAAVGADGFAPGPLWRAAVGWATGAALWAAVGAGLVAAVLDGRQAGWIVLVVAIAGLTGTSAVVVDMVARRHGIAAARRVLATGSSPSPLRRRAWREFAIPLAVTQALFNGGAAWVLFHSYHRPSSDVLAGGSPGSVLTSHVALADALTIIVIIGFVFSTLSRTVGSVDRAMGRVTLDAPEEQVAGPGSPFGPQVLVYVGAIGLVLAKVAQVILPAAPNLIEVGVARGLIVGLMVLATVGFGYTRGALNTPATRTASPASRTGSPEVPQP